MYLDNRIENKNVLFLVEDQFQGQNNLIIHTYQYPILNTSEKITIEIINVNMELSDIMPSY